jgi:hypothetical protein
MGTAQDSPSDRSGGDEHVVARLRNRLREATQLGLRVRMELLGDEQASWCEIAGVPTLFVDLSQSAAEQLRQVDEALATFRAAPSAASDRPQPGSLSLAKRVA